MLREMGCLDQLSARAAASTSCSSVMPSAGWTPVTLKVPWVRVPVLSNTTTPRVFYVSEFGWVASLIFLCILQATLTSQDERSFRCRRAWLAPAFGVPLLAFYCTFGDILSNLIWCGMMIWLSFCAIRGLVYTNGQTGTARNMRWFHIGVLCFAGSEYLLWTAGCFWPDTSPASPTFWCDMLLTLAILGLLPATRKAVVA